MTREVEAEVVDGLPVVAEPAVRRGARRRRGACPRVQAAALAATGFVAGATTVAVVVAPAHASGATKRRKKVSAFGEIVSSNSFLVDVHLLRRGLCTVLVREVVRPPLAVPARRAVAGRAACAAAATGSCGCCTSDGAPVVVARRRRPDVVFAAARPRPRRPRARASPACASPSASTTTWPSSTRASATTRVIGARGARAPGLRVRRQP